MVPALYPKRSRLCQGTAATRQGRWLQGDRRHRRCRCDSNRERSMRLQGAALPNLKMGNAPKTPGGKGSAMDMKGNMSWSDIEFCRQESGLPVIIKSILSPTQALQA